MMNRGFIGRIMIIFYSYLITFYIYYHFYKYLGVINGYNFFKPGFFEKNIYTYNVNNKINYQKLIN